MGIWESTLLLDASSVIAFVEEVGRPELLPELARQATGVEIPDTVLNELVDPDVRATVGSYGGVSFFEAAALGPYADLFDRYPQLGSGELGVIARGVEMQSLGRPCVCVLDDAGARSVAEQRGLAVVGTIGLLLELEQVGAINRTEHVEILSSLREAGFRYDWQNHPLGSW